nr:hypothetical protein [uncultured Dysosmobacter sp.]
MAAKETAVIEPHALAAALDQGLEAYKFLYIAAPAGWGKATAVRWHFRLRRCTYVSLWDEDALERAEKDASGLLLLDDCHVLSDQPERRERLFELLKKRPAGSHAVLLSRAALPGRLLPLQLSGLLATVPEEALALGAEDAAGLAAAFGLELSREEVLRLVRESRGHPLSLKLVCIKLSQGAPLNSDTLRAVSAQMFGYLDRQLSDYWGGRLYRLVQAVSFFDSFTLGLAGCSPETIRWSGPWTGCFKSAAFSTWKTASTPSATPPTGTTCAAGRRPTGAPGRKAPCTPPPACTTS